MSAPTTATRAAVYRRDGYMCVTCTATSELTWQHRRRVGMGGSKDVPSPVDGVTACATCNAAYEAELQTVALAYGWKVKSWVQHPENVPVYVPFQLQWYRLEGVRRVPITAVVAHELMTVVYGWETWIRWYQEAKR